MADARLGQRAKFAVGARVYYQGKVLTVCGMCQCGPMWLYKCRSESEPDTVGRLHAERFLELANDVQLRTSQPAEHIRHRQFARRAER
jgi:hypothetical protein